MISRAPSLDEFVERRAGVLALAEFRVDGREGLAGEFARGVVVGGAHQRAGQRVVLGGNVLNREGLARMRLPQHADLDRQRLGERGGGEEQKRAERGQGASLLHAGFKASDQRDYFRRAAPLGRERGRRARPLRAKKNAPKTPAGEAKDDGAGDDAREAQHGAAENGASDRAGAGENLTFGEISPSSILMLMNNLLFAFPYARERCFSHCFLARARLGPPGKS